MSPGCVLLAIGTDEALDELLDVAGLGQATRGELVGQFSLGQTRIGFPGLLFLGILDLRFLLTFGLLDRIGLLPSDLLALSPPA